MSYVIMNVGTGQLYRKPSHYCPMTYPTVHGARIACAKLNKSFGNCGQWKVITSGEFTDLYDPIVTVFNCLTGKPCQIRKSEVGGCCDPSTERYHSM